MKRTVTSLWVAAVLFAGCGEPDPAPQPGDQVGDGDGDDSGDGDSGDGDDSNDGSDGDGSDGDGSDGDGDEAGDGDGVGDGDGDTDTDTPGAGPKIPAVTDCPTFKSGKQTIMGLETKIVAGTPSKDNKGPLMIYWHGTGSSPDAELGTSFGGLIPKAVQDDIVAQGGMIVAAHDLQGASVPDREGTDVTYGKVWFTTHDFAFADLVVGCAVKNYGVDPKRIYTTGCSAGGLMAGVMEIQHGTYLAATTANSGGLTTKFGFTAPSYVAPVLLMYGTPANDTVGIAFETSSNNLSDLVRGKGGFVIKCNHDKGHCQAPPELQTAAWQFMKDHPYGITASPYAKKGLPTSFPDYCEIVK